MNNLKAGDLIFCDSDGNCEICLGFIPKKIFVDSSGNYTAIGDDNEKFEGIVPFEFKNSDK